MTAEIIDFPDRRGEGMTPEERVGLLLDAHAAIIEAITEHQTPDQDVPVVLSLDEAMTLCQAIEDLIGLEHFTEDEE